MSASPSMARNTLFNMVDTGLRLSLSLVLSPILFWSLGAQTYGLWTVIWAFSGSLALADLRLNAAMTPLIAAADKAGNADRLRRLVNNGLLFYGALGGLILAVVLLVLKVPALHGLIPLSVRASADFVLPAAAAVFSLTTLLTLSTGVLNGLQRYDVTAMIKMVAGLARALLLVGVALLGGTLHDLVLVEVGITVVHFVSSWIAVIACVPAYRLSLRPDAAVLRELAAFGSRLQVGHVAHLVAMHFDKLILAAMLGLPAVAFYDLGAKIVGIARTLPPLFVSATMPIASAMHTAGEKTALWTFLRDGTQILAWTGMPIFLWVCVAADPLLAAWAGVASVESRLTLWLLSGGFFIKAYSEMGYSVVLGIGRPDVEMKRSLMAGGLNIVLSAGLIHWIGFAGAPLGTSLALTVAAVMLLAALVRHFDQPFGALLRPLLLPLATAVPAGAAAWAILRFVPPGRYQSIPWLAGAAIAIALIYLAAARAAGILRDNPFVAFARQMNRKTEGQQTSDQLPGG